MNFARTIASVAVIVVGIAGCGQNSALGPAGNVSKPPSGLKQMIHGISSQKISHVVIVIQENRTVNDLFNGFSGAGTVLQGLNSKGQTVKLRPISLTAPYDISHAHSAFTTEYSNGNMNGFDLVGSGCRKNAKCPPADVRAYGYVPKHEVAPYFDMARQYVFARNMFQTNEGPSFPGHQYLVSGTSTIDNSSTLRASENPTMPNGKSTGGCDSPPGSTVTLIDLQGNENQTAYPCFDRISLVQLIDAKGGLTWHYYENRLGAGLWQGLDAVKAVHDSPEFSKNVVAPPSQVLTDIDSGNLANVVWVTPTPLSSDHANITDGTGPSWVASIVNRIGASQYWNSTAIFVTWDDWGGWYDPMPPQILNSYELGFRVPLLVISPYAKAGYISTPQHEFASILKFTEEVFGLGSMGTTDTRADDLMDCFNFTRGPRKFVPIPAPHKGDYFLHQRPDYRDVDD